MKPAAPHCRDKHHQYHNFFKKHKFPSFPNKASIFIYTTSSLAILFTFYHLYNPMNTQNTNTIQEHNQIIQSKNGISPNDKSHQNLFEDSENSCDLFKGKWVPDARGSLYTNHSCITIPYKINCFLHGRTDTDFLAWRWKPDKCELPRFDPETFLRILQGKTMAFIGDSISRNQMESLICLLSTVETPIPIHKDADDRFTTWNFPKHDFTVMSLWSQFLVTATERIINGSSTGGFDLHLDKIDTNWSEKLPSIDYAIFSDAHWFFRQNYLYENGDLIGCVYCQAPNVTDLGPGVAIRKAFESAFKEINNCKNCRKIVALLRTFSPSHFEGGTWNNGGGCNRTSPIGEDEVSRGGSDWEYRRIQVEESEIARNRGEESENMFEVLDITEIMVMRPDGHPGVYWGNRWMKGYSDCIHWCLPGPIDVWNELLLEVIRRQVM